MKSLLTISLILVSILSFGQTKLYTIGILDNSDDKYSSNEFYTIISDIQPDIILYECDPACISSNFRFDSISCPLILSSVETKAISMYQDVSQIDVAPFDMEGRNKFYSENSYFEKEKEMFNDIGLSLSENKINSENIPDFDLLWSVLSLYSIKKYSLQEINSTVFADYTEYKHAIVHDLLISIAKRNKVLNSWIEYTILRKKHWEERNKAMVNNISFFLKDYKDKKILVISGAEHKYYINNYFNTTEYKSVVQVINYWKDK